MMMNGRSSRPRERRIDCTDWMNDILFDCEMKSSKKLTLLFAFLFLVNQFFLLEPEGVGSIRTKKTLETRSALSTSVLCQKIDRYD